MSNLLKSKFLLGVMTATLVVAGFAFANVASADCSISTTVREGSKGADVQCLQTKLGITADGSFGPKTKAAVVAFQASHGLTADGVVGPKTSAALGGAMSGNFPAGCTSAAGFSSSTGIPCNSGPSMGLPAGCSSTSGFSITTGKSCSDSSSPVGGSLSGGETTISNEKTDSADDDTLDEGASKADVATIKFKVEDADAKLLRADLVFEPDGGNDEDKPWNVFDKVYLMDGNTTIASMSTDSKSDWDESETNSDLYRVRLTGISDVFKEGTRPELTVAVDVASSVDGADSGDANWSVYSDDDGLRFTDGAGLDTFVTPDGTGDFSIETSGTNSDITITKDSSSPDAGTLEVDETSSTTATVAVFKVKADADGGDVKIDDFPVAIDIGDADTSDVVSDVYLVVDGTTYNSDDTVDTDGSNSDDDNFHFSDIEDDDVVINAGDTMKITVKVKFKAQGNDEEHYSNGETVQATADASDSDFEDADSGDDVGDVSGAPSGEVLQLYTQGLSISNFKVVGDNPTVTQDNDGVNTKLTWKVSYDLTAFGDTFYVPKGVAQTTLGSNGLSYEVFDETADDVTTSGTESASTLSSSADDTDFTGYYTVNEGDTETFTATISVATGSIDSGDFVRLQLLKVGYNMDGSGADNNVDFTPAQDYDTSSEQLESAS
jgi:hypothetical protein